MKYTDYAKVFELAKNIVRDVRAIDSLCELLQQNLRQLEGSFLDDGIEDVQAFVDNLQDQIVSSQEALEIVADQLCDYGDLLKEGK